MSFCRPDQISLAIEVCQSFAVDNGAFSAWKSGKPIADWGRYYEWVGVIHRYPSFDFAVIPDVIDGDEQANDALVAEWPWRGTAKGAGASAPLYGTCTNLLEGSSVLRSNGRGFASDQAASFQPLATQNGGEELPSQ